MFHDFQTSMIDRNAFSRVYKYSNRSNKETFPDSEVPLLFFIEVVGRGLKNYKELWYPYYFVMGSILLCIEIVLSCILKSGSLWQKATGKFSTVL